jgi:hypothetical protein
MHLVYVTPAGCGHTEDRTIKNEQAFFYDVLLVCLHVP